MRVQITTHKSAVEGLCFYYNRQCRAAAQEAPSRVVADVWAAHDKVTVLRKVIQSQVYGAGWWTMYVPDMFIHAVHCQRALSNSFADKALWSGWQAYVTLPAALAQRTKCRTHLFVSS